MKDRLKKLKAKVKYIPLQGNYLLVNEDDLIKFLDNDSHLVEKHVSPPPKFEDGVVYALARLIDLFDEPVIAYGVLHESGIDLSKIKSDDAKILRKAGKQKVKS